MRIVLLQLIVGLIISSSVTAQPGRGQTTTEIQFAGLQTVAEKDLRNVLSENMSSLNGQSAEQSFDKAGAALRQHLVSHGYMDAVVRWSRNPQSINFIISEGARFGINEIVFEGSTNFSPDELALHTKKCLERYDLIKAYQESSVEYCVRRTANFIRAKGYLQAQVDEPQVARAGAGLLNLAVKVRDGIPYRLGDIRIDGVKRFSVAQTRAYLPLQKGEIANGEALSKWLFQTMKNLYGAEGYICYTAEIVPHFRSDNNEMEGTVDIDVIIDEGKKFKVGSIKINGDARAETHLKSLISIREGDVFDCPGFNKSIDQVNELRLFEPIDQTRDVTYEVNEERAAVNIVINVNRTSAVR